MDACSNSVFLCVLGPSVSNNFFKVLHLVQFHIKHGKLQQAEPSTKAVWLRAQTLESGNLKINSMYLGPHTLTAGTWPNYLASKSVCISIKWGVGYLLKRSCANYRMEKPPNNTQPLGCCCCCFRTGFLFLLHIGQLRCPQHQRRAMGNAKRSSFLRRRSGTPMTLSIK